MHSKIFAVSAALVLLAASTAGAATQRFTATLRGADEVPANQTKGSGQVSATLDTTTKVLTYKATYSGLSGPATMAHFHGPAAPGVNAPPTLPVTKPASPIVGSATLSDAQITDLTGGKWYFNVHTAAHPGGEIRGQLKSAP